MQFEYEIKADQFVASQLLAYKLGAGRKHRQSAFQYILWGVVLVAIALAEWSVSWTSFLLALIGAWWIWSAVKSLFLTSYFRREYPKSEIAGKKFKADVGEESFEVTGDDCSWRVRWVGVRVKGENEQVFLLKSYGTLFVFGKEYLSTEQQEHLRRLSGLA